LQRFKAEYHIVSSCWRKTRCGCPLRIFIAVRARLRPLLPCRIIPAGRKMAAAINPFRLLSELIVFLLGALLILLAVSGRVGLPARPAALIALGAFFVYWGFRAGIKPEPGVRPYESKTRAASLALVGFSILAIPMLPARFAGMMLGIAGVILVLRGLLGALFSLRRNSAG
jgi:hypothetical protein